MFVKLEINLMRYISSSLFNPSVSFFPEIWDDETRFLNSIFKHQNKNRLRTLNGNTNQCLDNNETKFPEWLTMAIKIKNKRRTGKQHQQQQQHPIYRYRAATKAAASRKKETWCWKKKKDKLLIQQKKANSLSSWTSIGKKWTKKKI